MILGVYTLRNVASGFRILVLYTVTCYLSFIVSLRR